MQKRRNKPMADYRHHETYKGSKVKVAKGLEVVSELKANHRFTYNDGKYIVEVLDNNDWMWIKKSTYTGTYKVIELYINILK